MIRRQASSKSKHFVKPKDQKGLQIATANCHTTAKVEAALDAYIKAVGVARLGVAGILRELSSELEEDMESLVCAASFALVTETLKEHTREAVQRGWSLPKLHPDTEVRGHIHQNRGVAFVSGRRAQARVY